MKEKLDNFIDLFQEKIGVHKQFVLLPSIAMLFVSCLIIANVTASKPLSLGWFVIPGGALIFPIDYLFGNILTEVYGFKWARFLIYTAVVCNLICMVYIMIVGGAPSASYWHSQLAYDKILGVFPKIVFASSLSYLVGEYMNSVVISRLKVFTTGKHLWLRAITSTLIGSSLDSIIFIPIAFWGIAAFFDMIKLGFSLTFIKVSYEVLALPLTYIIVYTLKRIEGVDIYDYGTSYTPFSLDLSYSKMENKNIVYLKNFNKDRTPE